MSIHCNGVRIIIIIDGCIKETMLSVGKSKIFSRFVHLLDMIFTQTENMVFFSFKLNKKKRNTKKYQLYELEN